jgi:hypothetical protein
MPTIPTDSLPIPVLAHTYKGAIVLQSVNALITIAVIKQNHLGHIQGTITIGAPLAKHGSFGGTVDSSHIIRFTFTPDNRSASIQFAGVVNQSGLLIGGYSIPGEGKAGSWQVLPSG